MGTCDVIFTLLLKINISFVALYNRRGGDGVGVGVVEWMKIVERTFICACRNEMSVYFYFECLAIGHSFFFFFFLALPDLSLSFSFPLSLL